MVSTLNNRQAASALRLHPGFRQATTVLIWINGAPAMVHQVHPIHEQIVCTVKAVPQADAYPYLQATRTHHPLMATSAFLMARLGYQALWTSPKVPRPRWPPAGLDGILIFLDQTLMTIGAAPGITRRRTRCQRTGYSMSLALVNIRSHRARQTARSRYQA
jgi:hypothetical protein